MKVYCFGNEFLDFDAVAKELADEITLKGVEFIKADSPEELEGKEIFILDVAEGIDKVVILEDVSKLKEYQRCSCHDLDLGFYLQLKKELGELGKVKIICIPLGSNIKKVKKEVVSALKSLTPK